jgi:hypothetical protein
LAQTAAPLSGYYRPTYSTAQKFSIPSCRPRNICRVFVREVGMTPGRLVELARVEAARS